MDLAALLMALRFGARRSRMLKYLVDHPELDEEQNLGDLTFHRGPSGRVTWEERRRGDIDLAA